MIFSTRFSASDDKYRAMKSALDRDRFSCCEIPYVGVSAGSNPSLGLDCFLRFLPSNAPTSTLPSSGPLRPPSRALPLSRTILCPFLLY